jgi:hypothetical protein
MAESDDAQVQRTSPLGLVRSHVPLVLTLIPILLSGLRILAVANGDRPTLVTLLSTLDVKAVLLGTFAWLLPTAFGVAAAIFWIRWLQLGSVSRPLGPGQRTALLWLAVCTTILALILFAFASVNDLFNLLLCLFAVYFFRKPERNRVGQAVITGAAFLTLVLAPVVFRAANMWLPAEKIVLKNQPAIVAYVLAADPRYATVCTNRQKKSPSRPPRRRSGSGLPSTCRRQASARPLRQPQACRGADARPRRTRRRTGRDDGGAARPARGRRDRRSQPDRRGAAGPRRGGRAEFLSDNRSVLTHLRGRSPLATPAGFVPDRRAGVCGIQGTISSSVSRCPHAISAG